MKLHVDLQNDSCFYSSITLHFDIKTLQMTQIYFDILRLRFS